MCRRAVRRLRLACIFAALTSVAAFANPGGTVSGVPTLDAVIVGDSLTGGNASYIRSELDRAGLDVRVEGLSARRIALSFSFKGYRDSGIERVRRLHADGVKPALWVVQLGTNDLTSVQRCDCPDPVAFAGELIDRLLTEIGSETPIAWVTVVNRNNWDATNAFNQALAQRAAGNPYLVLIRWKQLATPHPEWFQDSVHPNVPGLLEFTRLYIDSIRALQANPLGPQPMGDGLHRAIRGGG